MSALTLREGVLAGGGTWSASDQGAQLMTWAPGHQPVLLLSAASWLEAGRPIRGGVPLCFPWFGPGRGEPKQPSHGFARLAAWTLDDLAQGPEGTRLDYRLTERDVVGLPGAQHFTAPFEARCRIELGTTATVGLSVRNTGDAAFTYEAALHSYLYVGDVARVRVRGLDGASWFDKLDGGTHRQEGDLTLAGETDRVYHATGVVEVDDPVLDRVLVVDKQGSADTVLWTPGPDQAAVMDDLAAGEWQTLLCVEAGNVLDHAVSLEPGQEHALSTTISTRSR